MKSTLFLVSAVALFAGMASANLHPYTIKKWRCNDQLKRTGIKCKRGDAIHVKRDDGNKFHLAAYDEAGQEVDLPEVDISALREAEI